MEIPEISDVDVAFGGVKHLPKWSDIPEEFKNGNTIWNQMQSDWFYKGIKKSQLTTKAGVDKEKAFKALAAIQGSWRLKHEHKQAAVAYLASQWFEKYETGLKPLLKDK